MKLVYDLECNGLTPDKIWCIVAYNIDTQMVYKFSDFDNLHGSIKDGVRLLENADLLIGHNIINFDNRVIDDLYNTDLNSKQCHDTFIMSQVLSYKRDHKHGLAGWGQKLGNQKWDFDQWDQYSREMLKYCVQDVMVNYDVYKVLLEEYTVIYKRNPKIKEGLRIEHDCAIFNLRVRQDGWKFDLEGASETHKRMLERMEEIELILHPKLGNHTVYDDKTPRTPKFKKNGEYNVHTVKQLSEYFGETILSTDIHRMPPGTEFQRSHEEQIDLGSTELVKEWLLANGWKPDEYQKKKIGFEWVTTGPKLTDTSLEEVRSRWRND